MSIKLGKYSGYYATADEESTQLKKRIEGVQSYKEDSKLVKEGLLTQAYQL